MWLYWPPAWLRKRILVLFSDLNLVGFNQEIDLFCFPVVLKHTLDLCFHPWQHVKQFTWLLKHLSSYFKLLWQSHLQMLKNENVISTLVQHFFLPHLLQLSPLHPWLSTLPSSGQTLIFMICKVGGSVHCSSFFFLAAVSLLLHSPRRFCFFQDQLKEKTEIKI